MDGSSRIFSSEKITKNKNKKQFETFSVSQLTMKLFWLAGHLKRKRVTYSPYFHIGTYRDFLSIESRERKTRPAAIKLSVLFFLVQKKWFFELHSMNVNNEQKRILFIFFFLLLYTAKSCPANMVYSETAPACARICENRALTQCNIKSVPGCTCAEGMFWNGDTCVKPESCPCYHGGHAYKQGKFRYESCQVW